MSSLILFTLAYGQGLPPGAGNAPPAEQPPVKPASEPPADQKAADKTPPADGPAPTSTEAIDLKNAWRLAPRDKNGKILPFEKWDSALLQKLVKRASGSTSTFGELTGLVAAEKGVGCTDGEHWSKTWGWCVAGARADYQAETEGRMFRELRRETKRLDGRVDSVWSELGFEEREVPQFNDDGTEKLDKDGKPVTSKAWVSTRLEEFERRVDILEDGDYYTRAAFKQMGCEVAGDNGQITCPTFVSLVSLGEILKKFKKEFVDNKADNASLSGIREEIEETSARVDVHDKRARTESPYFWAIGTGYQGASGHGGVLVQGSGGIEGRVLGGYGRAGFALASEQSDIVSFAVGGYFRVGERVRLGIEAGGQLVEIGSRDTDAQAEKVHENLTLSAVGGADVWEGNGRSLAIVASLGTASGRVKELRDPAYGWGYKYSSVSAGMTGMVGLELRFGGYRPLSAPTSIEESDEESESDSDS